jgi:hypothetical protein
LEKLTKEDNLEGLVMHAKIIIKLIFKKQGARVWTEMKESE